MEQPALRARPERAAWLVVWAAFAVFSLLVVFAPLTVRHVLLYSTVAHPTTVQALEGTAVIDNPSTGEEFAVTKGQLRTIDEGSVLSLDDTSRAALHFFDGSSVHLRPGSRVSLERVRGPRFSLGVRPISIWLRVVSGRVKVVTTAPSRPAGLDFVLRCPVLGADVSISGAAVIGVEAESKGAEIFANRGSAVVSAGGKSVRLVAPERTMVKAGWQPEPPIADARELIVNGGFQDRLEQGWTVFNDQGNDGGDVAGTAVRTIDEGLPAVRFYRTGSERNHCETVIEQKVDRDLPDPVSSLEVRAYLKLINQSLSGGGYMGSEFPLIIRLKYRDIYGSENEWVKGFYYEPAQGNPTGTAEAYPKDSWQLYESGNLLEILEPKPFRIVSLRVYASGWDYESMFRWISVAVQ